MAKDLRSVRLTAAVHVTDTFAWLLLKTGRILWKEVIRVILVARMKLWVENCQMDSGEFPLLSDYQGNSLSERLVINSVQYPKLEFSL